MLEEAAGLEVPCSGVHIGARSRCSRLVHARPIVDAPLAQLRDAENRPELAKRLRRVGGLTGLCNASAKDVIQTWVKRVTIIWIRSAESGCNRFHHVNVREVAGGLRVIAFDVRRSAP
jgi:hypothetical protein